MLPFPKTAKEIQIHKPFEMRGRAMIRTRFTDMFGIRHPITQGGMGGGVGNAELVAAVANAGALGFITALNQPTPEDLSREIRRCYDMTDAPFGVNLTILPTIRKIPYDEYARAIIESGVKIIETAGNNPAPWLPVYKEADIKVIHKCTSVRHAVTAERLGVDAISIDGFECAGHPGEDDIGGLVLIPATADKIGIPMIASGGFADGRGLAAALALGADGINMGTRFMATREAPVHENIKDKIVASGETDTTLILRSMRNTSRVFRNPVSAEVTDIEKRSGSGFGDVKDLVAGARGKLALKTGRVDDGIWSASTAMGLIRDIPDCAQLVARIVSEAEAIIRDRLPGVVVPSPE